MLLPEEKIEKASEVAARAFQDDPLRVYYHKDPIKRKAHTLLHCKSMILLGYISGEVYTKSKNVECVAVWHPHRINYEKIMNPSKDIIKKFRNIRRIKEPDSLIREKKKNVIEIFGSLHEKHAAFPHWYLTFLAVDPSHQGKGYASMLMRPKLREIDKQNLPCYLNTQNEKNVLIYEHFGFEVVAKQKIPNSNVYYFGMLRECKK